MTTSAQNVEGAAHYEPAQGEKSLPADKPVPRDNGAAAPSPVHEQSPAEGGRSAGPEWLQKVQDKIQAQEDAKVYQLALWAENKRAMPVELVRSALFAAIQGKDAAYVTEVEIASANDLKITYTGKRLTQVHADVWEGVMHLARGQPESARVAFRAKAFLRLIGRHTGKSQRDELKRLFAQLTATSVEVRDTKNNKRFWGSLLPHGASKDDSDDSTYVVEINRHLATLFERGFTTVDWEQRKRLRAKPLSLWLQHHFAAFDKPITVKELHRLSGSTARQLRQFRAQLKMALAELESVGVLASWRLDDQTDAVHVCRAGRQPELSTAPVPASLPSDSATLEARPLPVVTSSGKAQFRKRYPNHDLEQCIADWHRWLRKKGLSAERPDAAFLGFARGWVNG